MASFLRPTTMIAARACRLTINPARGSYQTTRFAHGSYGNSQSGHQKSDAPNPQVDMEHPGPKSHAEQDGTKSSSSSQASSQSTGEGGGSASTPSSSPSEKAASDKSTEKSTSSGAKPALGEEDGQDTNDPEVKKHNKDMQNRADRTPNQIG